MSGPVAVVGAGLIGQSWAISFARGGREVRLFDPSSGVAEAAAAAVAAALPPLAALGLLDGQDASEVAGRVRAEGTLAGALAGTSHVQENAPERLEVKRALFAELDAAAPPEAVLASSTSALLPSAFTASLAGAHRCLVAHPLNPPHLIPAVEIVPSPATSQAAVAATLALMEASGQSPFVVGREVPGFVMNRLQGALLDEAMALVDQGLASVADVDRAMRDGLARRWALMGPFETIDLNALGGVAAFIDRYGPTYAEIGRDRPRRPAWDGELAARVVAARRDVLPADRLAERGAWRDGHLARLAAHLREVED